MSSKNKYSRKISAKEAKKNFIFILKNNLSFFPPLGEVFVLKGDDSSCEVKVESFPAPAGDQIYPMNITLSNGKD
ncbi:hypothetical protein [Methanobacterium sp.]|uniref:hypothetical protein n=1 Tax=Methanobacterium sp. TaxID=2164 RepID=UPI0025E64303|nr:hypothetical protein [Methanobacterium sp.]